MERKGSVQSSTWSRVEVGTCYGVANLISAGSILNNITELARRSTSTGALVRASGKMGPSIYERVDAPILPDGVRPLWPQTELRAKCLWLTHHERAEAAWANA